MIVVFKVIIRLNIQDGQMRRGVVKWHALEFWA